MECKEEKAPIFFIICAVVIIFMFGYGICFLCTIINQDYSEPKIEDYTEVNKVRYNTHTKEVIIYKDDETIILK